MSKEERPIVFTISEWKSGIVKIVTTDPRGKDANVYELNRDLLLAVMVYMAKVFNAKGYAVLFEVD